MSERHIITVEPSLGNGSTVLFRAYCSCGEYVSAAGPALKARAEGMNHADAKNRKDAELDQEYPPETATVRRIPRRLVTTDHLIATTDNPQGWSPVAEVRDNYFVTEDGGEYSLWGVPETWLVVVKDKPKSKSKTAAEVIASVLMESPSNDVVAEIKDALVRNGMLTEDQ